MGTGELNAGGNPAMDWHPIQGGVEILLVFSCYGNRDNLSSGLKGHLARMQTFFGKRAAYPHPIFLVIPLLPGMPTLY